MPTPKNCKLCKLGCGKAVPGHGPKAPRLIVVSDYPGKNETEQGLNMVGKAGQLMRSALKNVVGVDPETEVFFMNVIRCEPGDQKVTPAMLTSCRRWTQEDLREVDCNLILIAGAQAFETMLPNIYEQEKLKDKKFGVGHAHGSVYQHLGKTYMVTWNPAAIEANSFRAPDGNILKILDGLPKKAELSTCFPTGSMPKLFVQDLERLKMIVETHYGIPAQA
jgi:uracil-DNA glycosylase family 4